MRLSARLPDAMGSRALGPIPNEKDEKARNIIESPMKKPSIAVMRKCA